MLFPVNKLFIAFITLWLSGIYWTITKFYSTTNNDQIFENQIKYLQDELELLKEKCFQLQSEKSIQYQEFQNELKRNTRQSALHIRNLIASQKKPPLEYEQLRRKMEIHTRELSYFTINQMKRISDQSSDDEKQKWKNVTLRFYDQNSVLLASIRNLTKVDGYQAWREIEHENLSKLIQARLNAVQNPSKPCTDVQTLSCHLNEPCGFGCQIHRTMRCFLVAYIFGRTMILTSGGWSYNSGGFEQVFQPVSQVCNASSTHDKLTWGKVDFVYSLAFASASANDTDPHMDFMPMAIPEDLSERLIHLHGHPFVWFMGQFIKYLLRPQPWLSEFMKKKYEEIKFETPIVGIHVRRTDKNSEAAFHNVSEYMKYVEDYYVVYQYQNPDVNFTKRVYVATDEPTVFDEIRTKYPDYVVHGDITIAQSAQLNSRYSMESLKGFLLNIHFLSLCDFLVCTFSSQVCRAVYEIMQQRVVDGAWRVQSLDDVYFFESQDAHNQRALISHKAVWPDEFGFERGDIIQTEGNHWDGFSRGLDKTNGQAGLYPSYKTEEIIKIGKMYTYPEAKIRQD